MLAVCPNDNTMLIYGNCNKPSCKDWTLLHTLDEHDLLISAIDWSPVTNMIVTCSHDRNAFVWTYDEQETKWKPSLVILRINRAALDVKWSPDGKKFAVASGAKCVPVCYFEEEHDWWVSKHIKKHKSTVLTVAWHPNSQILATGSSDFKCRVFSSFITDVDATHEQGAFPSAKVFEEEYASYGAFGWIDSVAWSPSGSTLAFSGHDSSIQFVDYRNGGDAAPQSIRYRDLPVNSLLFLSENAAIGAGHDMNPLLFTNKTGQWAFDKKLEEKKKEEKKEVAKTGVAAARALFQNKTTLGQAESKAADKLSTTHESAITCMKAVSAGNGNVKHFATSGLDGKIVFWDLSTLGIDMAALSL